MTKQTPLMELGTATAGTTPSFARQNKRITITQLQWEKVQAHIEQIKTETSQPDWDCEGGEVIPNENWEAAADICLAIIDSNLPVPWVSASGDGAIHMSVLAGTTKVLLEVKNAQMAISTYDKHHKLISHTGIVVLDKSMCLQYMKDAFQKSIYQ
jgi:hypothetical protein